MSFDMPEIEFSWLIHIEMEPVAKMEPVAITVLRQMLRKASPEKFIQYFLRQFPNFLSEMLRRVEQAAIRDIGRIAVSVRENIILFEHSIARVERDWKGLPFEEKCGLCDVIFQNYKIPKPVGKPVSPEYIPNSSIEIVLTDMTKYYLYLKVRMETTLMNYELALAAATGAAHAVTMDRIDAVHELLKLVITNRHPRLVAEGAGYALECRRIYVEKVPVLSHQLLRADLATVVMVLFDCKVRIDLVDDHPTRSLEYRRMDLLHVEESQAKLFAIINLRSAPGDEWTRFHYYAKLPGLYFSMFMKGVEEKIFPLDRFVVEPVRQVVKTLRAYPDPEMLDFFRDCAQIATHVLLPTQRYPEAFMLIMSLAVRLFFNGQHGSELTGVLASISDQFPGPENERYRASAAAACVEPGLWLLPLDRPLVLQEDPFALMTGSCAGARPVSEDAPGAGASAVAPEDAPPAPDAAASVPEPGTDLSGV